MSRTRTVTAPQSYSPDAVERRAAVRAARYDRAPAPVYSGPDDWCLSADALAALAHLPNAELAAHVGDEDLEALYDAT